jgi:hypothetical protein
MFPADMYTEHIEKKHLSADMKRAAKANARVQKTVAEYTYARSLTLKKVN